MMAITTLATAPSNNVVTRQSDDVVANGNGSIECKQRLVGTLNFFHREPPDLPLIEFWAEPDRMPSGLTELRENPQ